MTLNFFFFFQIGLTCISRHPVQPHVLCTGTNDGVLAFWDLRMESHPVTLLTAHSQPISEVTNPMFLHIFVVLSWIVNIKPHNLFYFIILLKLNESSRQRLTFCFQVHFHDQQPDHLFSCSQNGDVLHWNGSTLARSSAAAYLNFTNQGVKD